MTQWGLDTLFNPAKRHMDEEKRRLQSTREQLGDSSGGKRIDLESGRVKINRAEGDDEADEAKDEAARKAAEKKAERESTMTDAQKRAQQRAAARRQAQRDKNS